ncbi:MAG: hypothetical protein WCC38_07935 [Pseudonocardiaceae bacterium]
MTDEVHRRLSAALRAQALSTGSSLEPASAAPLASPGREPAHAKPRLSASAVLVWALLLGVLAGGLAGLISAW